MQTFILKLIALMCLFGSIQQSFAAAEYALASGELTLPHVRISTANAEASCVAAKLQADNPVAPTTFKISQLTPIPQGLTLTYSTTQLLGDLLVLMEQEGNFDLFNVFSQSLSTVAPLPAPRYEFGLGRINDKLYLVGGWEHEETKSISHKILVYDLVSKAWSQLANELPIGIAQPKIVTVKDKLYVIGGLNCEQQTNKIQVFDPQTQQWSLADAQLPITLEHFQVYSLGAQILFAQYHDSLVGLDANSIQLRTYDPIKNSWQTLTELVDTSQHKILVIGEDIYNYAYADGAFSRFDKTTQLWTKLNSVPNEIRNNAFYALANKNDPQQLYFVTYGAAVFGQKNSVVVQRYHLATHQWQAVFQQPEAPDCPADAVYTPESAELQIPLVTLHSPTPPSKRFNVSLQFMSNSQFRLKQLDPSSNYQPAKTETYSNTQLTGYGRNLYWLRSNTLLRFNVDTQEWQNDANDLGAGINYDSAVATNDTIYGFGQVSPFGYPAARYTRFSLVDAKAELLDSTFGLPGAASALLNTKIFLLGAASYSKQGAKFSSAVKIYDLITGQSSDSVSLPNCTGNGAATVLNNAIYYSGGEGTLGSVCADQNFSTSTFDQFVRWNADAKQWEKLAPTPEPISRHQLIVWQHELYVLKNGVKYQNDGSPQTVSKAWIYNPILNQWRNANLPLEILGPNVHFQVLDDTLYALQLKATANSSWYTPQVLRFNPITQQWDNLTPTAETAPASAAIQAQGHIQDIGWYAWQKNTPIGLPQSGKRLEAVRLQLTDLPSCSIRYRVKVQNQGWTRWVQNAAVAGTTGQGLALENLEIAINPSECEGLSVNYRVALKGLGWQAWVKDLFHTNLSAVDMQNTLPIEALEVVLQQP